MTFEKLQDSDRSALAAAAAADNHGILGATHIACKNGEIVGYLGIGGIPLVTLWLSTQKVQALDSVRTFNFIGNAMSFAGHRAFIMPCMKDSPFYREAERLGFQPLEDATLFGRILK